MRQLWILFIFAILALSLIACDSTATDVDGDTTDGDTIDGDTTDGDTVDGDAIDGDVTDGDETDGDVADGDMIDGDVIDGDVVDGDETDGDETDGDSIDGDTDSDTIDGDLEEEAEVEVEPTSCADAGACTLPYACRDTDDGPVCECDIPAAVAIGSQQETPVIDGTTVYTFSGTQIIATDISDPSSASLLFTKDLGTTFYPVAAEIYQGYILMADYNGSLLVIDISSLQTDTVVTYSLSVSGSPTSLFVSGTRVYMANRDGVIIADISDPTAPALLQFLDLNRDTQDAVAVGDYLYVLRAEENLSVYNQSDLDNITHVGGMDLGTSYLWRMGFIGNYAYIGCGNDGVRVVDLGDATNPTPANFSVAAQISDIGYIYEVYPRGNRIFTRDISGGFSRFEVSDPTSPKTMGIFRLYDPEGNYTSMKPSADGSFVIYSISGGDVLYQQTPECLLCTEGNILDSTNVCREVKTPENAGDIIPTEIMVEPAVSSTDGQWIELLNLSEYALDLTGCELSDGSKASASLDGLLLMPGILKAMSRDGQEYYFTFTYGNTATFNSAGSTITLACGANEIFSLTYSGSDVHTGYSTALNPDNQNSTDYSNMSNWCAEQTQDYYDTIADETYYGSPGTQNTACAK